MLSGRLAQVILAQVIVHSVLPDTYQKRCTIYYLVGGVDMAIEHLCIDELPISAQHVVLSMLFNRYSWSNHCMHMCISPTNQGT